MCKFLIYVGLLLLGLAVGYAIGNRTACNIEVDTLKIEYKLRQIRDRLGDIYAELAFELLYQTKIEELDLSMDSRRLYRQLKKSEYQLKDMKRLVDATIFPLIRR